MFPKDLLDATKSLLDLCIERELKLATAESCTGGLIIGLLTDVAGSSAVVDRGFVTYSNQAKMDMLGVPEEILIRVGAVAEETAIAMAKGALANSDADITVAVTGIAGPGGATIDKPLGLVHTASAHRRGRLLHEQLNFGDIGRGRVRRETVAAAISLLRRQAEATTR